LRSITTLGKRKKAQKNNETEGRERRSKSGYARKKKTESAETAQGSFIWADHFWCLSFSRDLTEYNDNNSVTVMLTATQLPLRENDDEDDDGEMY